MIYVSGDPLDRWRQILTATRCRKRFMLNLKRKGKKPDNRATLIYFQMERGHIVLPSQCWFSYEKTF